MKRGARARAGRFPPEDRDRRRTITRRALERTPDGRVAPASRTLPSSSVTHVQRSKAGPRVVSIPEPSLCLTETSPHGPGSALFLLLHLPALCPLQSETEPKQHIREPLPVPVTPGDRDSRCPCTATAGAPGPSSRACGLYRRSRVPGARGASVISAIDQRFTVPKDEKYVYCWVL